MSEGEDDERFVGVRRSAWSGGVAGALEDDLLAREEPLELRVAGAPLAVVMRTPGHDEELARGFMLSEGIVAAASEIASARHCTTVDEPEAEDNVMLIRLAEGVAVDLAALRRNLYASSSCGVCGKASIAAVLAPGRAVLAGREGEPAADTPRISAALVEALPERLREGQPVFARTGGLHAAGLFTAAGERLVVREDVGRHNAVDKVIGWAAITDTALTDKLLMVSGRVSFEITQKAAAVGVPILAAVSAPSSLAVDLATRAGMTLIGFARGPRFCVYAGAERLSP
ncbi:formate dehydrogenase accessory sulfurtransferase FdhD [Pseudenhygromyxa sp. WMMC2535]|uniref:formate dehydrogenase accessory sulfurtransferase FdhD n=1 Tax=Pseudenhygromyxa sp. WMMC2535 TaxID=2712867 RepID=UPI0015564D6E|nr:formate dehydrogenase accessory sulfurtransferase FdhD [Pseudenhygromyxa sp. WMMC2535]NVB39250.1 formate dehydrogenase accessory sulfurtransferase FdhD [Pseudenhygromyxa sp. WMMC2535]